MANILIGYDLNFSGQRYDQLIAAIKQAFPNYWHCLDSTWIVQTAWDAVQVRDWLGTKVDRNDELFVVDITGKQAAWQGFSEQCGTWLKGNL